jgi:hypothetical protein
VGFFGDVAGRIRGYFRRDKEQVGLEIAKGSTASGYPTSGYDLLQAYGYDVLSDFLKLEHDLLSRYIDYEEMDDYPEVATAIDIFADDASQPETQKHRSVWVTSKDETTEQILNDLFHRQLRLDEEIWEIARTVVKYGNDFEEILVTDEGVRGLNFLAPPTVRRIEGPRGELYGFVQDFKGRFGYSPAEFQQIMSTRAAMRQGGADQAGGLGGRDRISALEDWEVVHFRLRGKHRRSVYGYSVLEPARWIWKRLMLLEDAALIYRLQRAPERYAFYVDIGDLPPNEAMAYLNRVRQQHRKKKWVNPTTGKLDLKFDPMSQDEDFFIPVRQGAEGTRIEVLGAPSWQHMEDIEYFRDKLFAAIKIPKAYLAQSESTSRAILSSEDVRFARTVLRIQRELRNGMSKIARVHLAALNIDPQAVEYNVHLTVPSAIFELAQLEVKNARADLASRMREFVSLHWIMSNVFGMNDEEIQTIFKERDEDAERDAYTQANAQSIIGKAVAEAGIAGQTAGQIDAQSMQAASLPPAPPGQEGQPAQPGAAPAPAATAKPQESRIRGPLIIVKPSTPPRRLYGREQQLFEGQNRESEKRAQEKLDQLLKGDRLQAGRLHELGAMLRELNQAVSGRRR